MTTKGGYHCDDDGDCSTQLQRAWNRIVDIVESAEMRLPTRHKETRATNHWAMRLLCSAVCSMEARRDWILISQSIEAKSDEIDMLDKADCDAWSEFIACEPECNHDFLTQLTTEACAKCGISLKEVAMWAKQNERPYPAAREYRLDVALRFAEAEANIKRLRFHGSTDSFAMTEAYNAADKLWREYEAAGGARTALRSAGAAGEGA